MIQRMSCSIMLVSAFTFASSFLACDSSSSTKKADAGTDAATDSATDAGTDAPDSSSDGPVLTALQARGKYLVEAVIACSDCHTPLDTTGRPDPAKFLAGNPTFVMLPTGDALPTRNLTNDATGLKNRTDDEIKGMFLNGIRPTAAGMEALNPVMPYYVFHNMKDEDANAIVAYLRTVPAVENEIPARSMMFDVPAAAPALDLANVPAVDDAFPEKESAVRGKYLATQIGLCVECHTKHLEPGMATVLDEARLFEGGEDFSAFFANTLLITPVSKNLTSDDDTGLGTWTTDDIVTVLHQGKAKDGSGICPPMPVGPMAAYGHLTDGDATDIANYIRSLPPKVHMVPDMCVFPPGVAGAGGGSGAGGGGGAGGAGGAGGSAP